MSTHSHMSFQEDRPKYAHQLLGSRSFASSDMTPALDGCHSDLEKALRSELESDQPAFQTRELGVMFRGLGVVGVEASTNFQPTLGSKLNPFNIIDAIQHRRHPATKDILSGLEGAVRPGEMLLVLGRPGAGCSTLLRILANQRSGFHAVRGDLHYDSFTPEEVYQCYRGDVSYCPEDDVHFPTLTVDQTIKFAARTRTDPAALVKRADAMTAWLETTFGLSHIKNTIIGNAALRGVSGGEKKRVSICETLATRSSLQCWDNPTRGLDASTALDFLRALRVTTDANRTTTIVSLQQAGDALFKLFDKVCVIYEGQMAYFGAADRARAYFIDMGFQPSHRQTTADFLVAVTDPDGRTVRTDSERSVPRTAMEFATHYKLSDICRINKADLDAYREEYVGNSRKAEAYRASFRAERASSSNQDNPYLISLPAQIRQLVIRRAQLERGALRPRIVQLIAFVVQAVTAGTVFLRLSSDTETFYSRGNILMFSLVWATFATSTEIPALFSQRPIVLRHFKAAMYHPFADTLALTLIDTPVAFITTLIFSVTLYFLAGLHNSFTRFMTFTVFLFLITLAMKGWFRTLAAIFKTPAPAQALGGLSMMFSVLYMGYLLPQSSMIGALRWITWIDPLRYGIESLLVNEFEPLNATCSTLIPRGPGYDNVELAHQVCTTVGSVPGESSVSGILYLQETFDFSNHHLWRNLGILIGFCAFFTISLLVATELKTSSAFETAVVLYKRQPPKSSKIKKNAMTRRDNHKLHHPEDVINISANEESRSELSKVEAGDVFTFQNISYTVSAADGSQKRLLRNVSGVVRPGNMIALMGESGAGKTTLLNVLSQRATDGVVTGDLLINGQPLPTGFYSQIGYCQQTDTHWPSATVREALMFSAKLRRPQSVSLSEKEAYVDECLTMCGLNDYSEAIIGTLGVEQRRRVTIGVELVAKPTLLFLDEPTSGLDSQSALAITKALRSLADKGQAIICTIHQPSPELFEMFDSLLLLRKGGETVYCGPLGNESQDVIDYFERHGSRSCRLDENPADFILDVITADSQMRSTIDWWKIWTQFDETGRRNDRLTTNNTNIWGSAAPLRLSGHFTTSWGYQLVALVERNMLGHWRNPVYLLSKFMLTIIAAIVIGFSFYKTRDTIQGTQDQVWAVYISTYVASPLVHQMFVPLMDMRNVYDVREKGNNMYHWTALLTSQLLVELPWNILALTMYFVCWYWTVGLPTDRAGYTCIMLSLLYPLYFTTVGQAIGALSPTPAAGSLIFSAIFAFTLIFDGVLQPFRQLAWWKWMNHVIPTTYLMEGIVGQALGRTVINCSPEELVIVHPPPEMTCTQYLGSFVTAAGGYLSNKNATDDCGYCPYLTKDAFLEQTFNMYYSHRWRDLGILCAFIAINVCFIYMFTYLIRVRTWTVLGAIRRCATYLTSRPRSTSKLFQSSPPTRTQEFELESSSFEKDTEGPLTPLFSRPVALSLTLPILDVMDSLETECTT